jgi:hypothetical protein
MVYRLVGGGGSGAAGPGCIVAGLSSITTDATFMVGWGASGGAGGLTSYDVQFLDSGRGQWRPWLSGTSLTAAAFTGQVGHRYAFRCRATDGANQSGNFSGAGDTATTIGSTSGGANLRISSLSVMASPAGGLWAEVTIQNDGADSTGRGFFVDLYLNDPPSGVGDYGGSVQAWVNEPLAAGASRTLTARVALGSGEVSATLTAFVDTTDAVPESNEGDNAYLNGVTRCLAAEDVYEDDNGPGSQRAFNPGNSQTHTIGGPGDEDWMPLNVQWGRFYSLYTSALSTGVDTQLRIVNAEGLRVAAFNDDGNAASLASALWWSPPAPGTYYAVVDNRHPLTGGCGAAYTVSLVDAGPGWVAFLPMLYR